MLSKIAYSIFSGNCNKLLSNQTTIPSVQAKIFLIKARTRNVRFSSNKDQQKEWEEQLEKIEKESEEKPLENENEQNSQRNVEAESDNLDMIQKQETKSLGWMIWRMFFWGSTLAVGYHIYQIRNELDKKQGSIIFQPYYSAAQNVNNQYQELVKFLTKPALNQLLATLPNFPAGYDPPKTLVINLTGTLVHTDFKFGKGIEIVQRPGLNTFLRKLSQMYQVVIFANDETMFAFSVCEQLDPAHDMLAGRLARESMCFENGKYIKNLDYLNRDLNRVVVIDINENTLPYHKDNCIFLPEFKGEKDEALQDLLPVLEYLANPSIKNVRKELQNFGNNETSKNFNEYMKEQRNQMNEAQQKGLSGIFDQLGGSESSNKTNLIKKFIPQKKY